MTAKAVLLSPRAQKEFYNLQKSAQARIKGALLELAAGKRVDVKMLKGVDRREDLYRLRVGDYRITYGSGKNTINVIRIDHRGKGYGWLE